ncbi:MAG: BrnA antitoxin family protein [Deltaproteobacteria bacterium]|jgi:predicted DNA binding CopG/RHH family protein|nr:BrnA antitoxin family protein [Deltaproteobacteria bacterium]MCZ6548452.1 BrnA antitoxin family protein [Deltaproteobacteria bacterium]MCZ6622165.1 BrnA antitoxin family protein [Deltaproteobacteria bacterium]MCZ6907183.1 BrnA antitoxin family protein [Deltaproteobacteria bacterium]
MSKQSRRSRKAIPQFSNEDEERRFWAKHDVLDYFDWHKAAQPAFPSLKPSTRSISLRLPMSMLEELKALANKRDVPYQSLMKVFLAERIEQERATKAS